MTAQPARADDRARHDGESDRSPLADRERSVRQVADGMVVRRDCTAAVELHRPGVDQPPRRAGAARPARPRPAPPAGAPGPPAGSAMLGHVRRHLAALEHRVEPFLGAAAASRRRGRARPRPGPSRAWPGWPPRRRPATSASISSDLARMQRGAQPGVHADHGVRDAHQLAELLGGRLVDGDEVARATCPSSRRRRCRPAAARSARPAVPGPRTALQLPPDQVVEGLVGAAELDVGADLDRVDALQQRVEELRQRDRLRARRSGGRSRRARAAGRR